MQIWLPSVLLRGVTFGGGDWDPVLFGWHVPDPLETRISARTTMPNLVVLGEMLWSYD